MKGIKFVTIFLFCMLLQFANAYDHIGIEVSKTQVKQPSYDWITLAFINHAADDIQLLHGLIAIESKAKNLRTGAITDAPMIVSDNILAIFDDAKQLLSVTNKLKLPTGKSKSTHFIAESLSALYGTSSPEAFEVIGEVSIEIEYIYNNEYYTLEKTIPLDIVFDSHIAEDEPKHWSKLKALLASPSSDIAHAYLVEKLLYLFSTEDKAALPFETIFEAFTKRKSVADGKYVLLEFIDTYYPDNIDLQLYYMSAITEEHYEIIDDLNYVSNIWNNEFLYLLMQKMESRSVNLSLKTQIANILQVQVPAEKDYSNIRSRIPTLLKKHYPLIFKRHPNALLFQERRDFAAIANIISKIGDRSNIDLFLPFLTSDKTVYDNSVPEYDPEYDYPKAGSLQNIALETILKLEELDINMVYYSSGYEASAYYHDNLQLISNIRKDLRTAYLEKYAP